MGCLSQVLDSILNLVQQFLSIWNDMVNWKEGELEFDDLQYYGTPNSSISALNHLRISV